MCTVVLRQDFSFNLFRFHSQKLLGLCSRIQLHSTSVCSDINSKLKLKNNPNKFGELSNESSESLHDEGDIEEHNYITYPVPRSQQLRIKQYADIIKQHLQNKQILAAISVLENRMIKEDRVQPDPYIYALVIGACGRFGETKKAFKLYNQMKRRGLKVPDAVYTGLFNACANSSDPRNGLKCCLHLQGLLQEKGVELNATHYNAMMKAYGRCGELSKAFQVADLMMDKEMQLDSNAFNFLLQACISDTQAGLRHALWVWQKMLQRKLKPSIYSFNLMLRCVRDCNLGEYEEMEKSIHQLLLESGGQLNKVHTSDETKLLANEDYPALPDKSSVTKLPVKQPWQFLPDLLSQFPRLNCDISSLDFTKPHERLLLLGGTSGFLNNMAIYRVSPNIKTYTLLLDCIPPTIASETNLIAKMRKDGIQIDTEFCNMLIKKRSFRFDYDAAMNVLDFMQEEKLLPDIVTFGVLALSCTNVQEARDLIRNMKQAGYRLNQEILGAMLKQGCLRHDFKYVLKMLYLTKEEDIKPSPLFMDNIERLISSSRDILRKMRNGEDIPHVLQKKPFKQEFTIFMNKYENWLKEIALNKPYFGTQKQKKM
ncbi:hypothetical protein R5R35_011572 [Gryllus longicercus]|uniref:Pentatricopeptide repeat-containing protein-mitochondrial domain-containing protein n=1 Tax=Gryllus longicercus TaxID=2509291 RepID=A0AAN9VQM3_9ORTH